MKGGVLYYVDMTINLTQGYNMKQINNLQTIDLSPFAVAVFYPDITTTTTIATTTSTSNTISRTTEVVTTTDVSSGFMSIVHKLNIFFSFVFSFMRWLMYNQCTRMCGCINILGLRAYAWKLCLLHGFCVYSVCFIASFLFFFSFAFFLYTIIFSFLFGSIAFLSFFMRNLCRHFSYFFFFFFVVFDFWWIWKKYDCILARSFNCCFLYVLLHFPHNGNIFMRIKRSLSFGKLIPLPHDVLSWSQPNSCILH